MYVFFTAPESGKVTLTLSKEAGKGDSYFELKDEWKKEKQRESRKTWAIGLLAAFGGLALTIIAQLIIRWMG